MAARRGAITVLGALAAVLMAGAAPPSATAVAPRACHPTVHSGIIPGWARGGFSAPRPRMPFAVSRHQRMAALVFGFPLLDPPDPRRANKILWVSHAAGPGHRLRISAQRMDGRRRAGAPLQRTVDVGPSTVNLPAGCWRLTLRWSGRSDQIDLRYRHHA
jgi:hypothetical protein